MIGSADILRESAARFGDKPALITAACSLSFAELNRMSDRVAAGLRANGVHSGHTVSLCSQNRWEWIVAYHGALKAGAVINPLNPMLTNDELAFALGDCGAVAIFIDDRRADDVTALASSLTAVRLVVVLDDDGWSADSTASESPRRMGFEKLLRAEDVAPTVDVDPLAPCAIGYTSGTTGRPKGAVQSQRAVLLNAALTATMHGRTSNDVVVSALPTSHVYGNVVCNATFIAGGTVVLMERFSARTALELIGRHRATMFEGVPTMYAMLLAEPTLDTADLSSLTMCTVGGQNIPGVTIERWQRRSGAPLLQLWGMTELAGLGATHPRHAPGPPESVGVSMPGTQLRIADLADATKTVAPGGAGELMVRGPLVMLGYHGNDAATRESISADGWLHTGDIATMDSAGHVFVVDRCKDLIITAGYNVYPSEVERVLAQHPSIAMVAAGPIPDPIKGELTCAYVVTRPGTEVSEDELTALAVLELAPYKRPRFIRFVEALPTTASGKVIRRELINMFVP